MVLHIFLATVFVLFQSKMIFPTATERGIALVELEARMTRRNAFS
jgi:hypothetical protein